MLEETADRAIAIVAAGAILPDAPNVPAFWENVKGGRYSITEVTPGRWDPALYYDPDPRAPEKTYSKIGGWVREYEWDPIKWKMAIPPRVVNAMDGGQRWALACTRQALEDYGYPKRALDADRTAVILGNAMGGEQHYLTSLRIYLPEFDRELSESATFAALPAAVRGDITRELRQRMANRLPEVTEDSMPGELANCTAGRVANVFNFHGPNFTADAACASAMAAMNSAAEGLIAHRFDAAITGGIDRNMGASSFVKFCKIGALSATGSRPYAEGADGFIMGEGAAIFILKRLADAERDGDHIYAVLRGIGGSSDGKGKGITAPNPIGQKFAIERAWENAGLSPATATYIEGHGTSTSVGDLVEIQSMVNVLGGFDMPPGSVALGSVKSNIGHLKGAAGGAGLLKAVLALRDRVLPPSLNCERKTPDVDFAHCPVYVNTELRPWPAPGNGGVRRAGVSAFGFGGTNWHLVLEEHIPQRLTRNGKQSVAVHQDVEPGSNGAHDSRVAAPGSSDPVNLKAPLRGALVIGASSTDSIAVRLRNIQKAAERGQAPAPAAPAESDLKAPERLVVDYSDAAELANKAGTALKALALNQPATWKALRAQGIFRGQGPAQKIAFLYTGQGSQYANMLRSLCEVEPIVAETFAVADQTMMPLIGKPLTGFVFVDAADPAAVEKAEYDLRQTEITQPVVLAFDTAMTRLLAAYGVQPDFVMGHSLGEYGALVAAGALPFDEALQAVSARGRGMATVSLNDNGRMAAVFAPIHEIERILRTIDGYVVIANINSSNQAVIGGASAAVERAAEVFLAAGYNAVPLPVSHAFHTSIVAPASEPLRDALKRLHLTSPRIPVVTNVTGEFYPTGTGVELRMIDLLARQVASPVQFVKGLQTLYDAGARVYLEVGPKKALQGFAEDVLGPKGDVISIFTNHPKLEDTVAFNQALCALYSAGLGAGQREQVSIGNSVTSKPAADPEADLREASRNPRQQPVTITGAALGLPGTERIFDDGNIARILSGENFIGRIPDEIRRAMAGKHITRLVKTDNGGPVFESIDDPADVIKLAGRGREFDLQNEFGIAPDRMPALDRVTQLAIAAGIDALRDAGIPMVMRYKTTTRNTQLPDRWGLPDAMRDDTGIIFASCWPGLNSFTEDTSRFYADRARREQLAELESVRNRARETNAGAGVLEELDGRIGRLRAEIEQNPYHFDRRFIFRILAMGHSQFAELIGARGPNAAINGACASTTQAVALAQDWIRAGRCRRVVIVAADDITSDHLLEWLGSAFLASGAAATDELVEDAALPFDRRRHGMIIGMGAAALVVERGDSARERGLRPICEVLGAVNANSAFHGTRLDIEHICKIMEGVVRQAESAGEFSRAEAASKMVFVSHETYTPARGGSASAEVNALRKIFNDHASQIVIANTKGLTGHAMGAGIEDVVAVKALETGCVPPVANFKEVDPELGQLNLSKGGKYPVEYALRLGAGFGSQIGMTLLRRMPGKDDRRPAPSELGYAYRIEDEGTWKDWLSRAAGYENPELEVAHRTLRIRDKNSASLSGERVQAAATTPVPAPVAVETRHAPVFVASQAAAAGAATAVAMAPATVVETSAPGSLSIGVDVKARILALVAEKTGYPVEMLDVDLDLEADLGVDTVKQAEVFATVREAYSIPRDEKLKLRDFPTLGHVIRFVYDRRPDLAAAPAHEPATAAVENTAAPQPAPQAGDVKQRILNLVAEKTGYPVEMLDLDLDLEADLGVDTVKQAEVFASVREAYSIPRDEKLKLRDFPTLGHVIQFVYSRRPDLAAAPAHEPATAAVENTAATQPAPQAGDVKQRILNLVAEKTGYPVEMLDLDLDLEADLGVDTVKQAEVFASVREAYSIPRDEKLKLRDFPTLGHVIQFVYDRRPDLAAAAPVAAEAVVQETQPSTSSAAALDAIKARILELVVDKTGYPPEMLDLDLDLEADLGVDTVKQAEMFAAIREIYQIPRDPSLKLRDFPTLAHVIRFVTDRRPDLAGTSIEHAMEPAPVLSSEPAAPRPPEQTALSEEAVREKVLDIVAEKTGYPKEMLDLDLDLEADLGIDTVKQAEMFASVREVFHIQRDANLRLRDFPTLAHVIRFARDRIALSAGVTGTPPAAPEQPLAAPPAPRPPLASLEPANRIPRRIPIPEMRPPLPATKATGVRLERGRRIVVAPDKGGVAAAITERLRASGLEVVGVEEAAKGPVHGIYWLPALDDEGDIAKMDLARWRGALQARVKSFFTTMRALYEQIATPDTFLISATRLGGQHGYGDAGAISPMGGAVTGFTKTYKRERAEALVKAVDFEAGIAASDIADKLIAETLRDPGAVEIGYKEGLRWTIGLEEQPPADGAPGLALGKDSVFLITGAAGGIVSAITADLAAASGGTFYLLDLAPEPGPANPDLDRLASDREGLKRDIFGRIQARGERATPALVEKELAALERMQGARAAIEAVRATGGKARYFSIDLTNAQAVAEVIEQIRKTGGRIDVLLHAAGMERSHLLPSKDPREFDLVFDVKADGWFNLLHAIAEMPLGATVAFSSIAGRFGNAGQADYSAANDLLCKVTSSFRRTHPATRAIAIDWTAWAGIGMATRGSTPKMMELAGIDMLAPEAGIPLIRRELTAGSRAGEIVVAEGLGVLLQEWDAAGGLDPAALSSAAAQFGPMTGRASGMTLRDGLVVETALDPKIQPFLFDHRIDGTPVLPGVMGVEAFCEIAQSIAPGWYAHAVENVEFLAPLKFYHDEPSTLTVQARFYLQGNSLVAACRLLGRRQLPNQAEPRVTTHFTASVRLSREAPRPWANGSVWAPTGGVVDAADIYRIYFHGPAYRVLHRTWSHGDWIVGEMARGLPPNHDPVDLPLAASPRFIELCFQTAGIWEMQRHGRMALPLHIDEVRLSGSPEASNVRLYALVTPNQDREGFDAEVVDEQGNSYLKLRGYRTIALPDAVDAEPLRRTMRSASAAAR